MSISGWGNEYSKKNEISLADLKIIDFWNTINSTLMDCLFLWAEKAHEGFFRDLSWRPIESTQCSNPG